ALMDGVHARYIMPTWPSLVAGPILALRLFRQRHSETGNTPTLHSRSSSARVRFATDWPLEETGFEPSVPPHRDLDGAAVQDQTATREPGVGRGPPTDRFNLVEVNLQMSAKRNARSTRALGLGPKWAVVGRGRELRGS